MIKTKADLIEYLDADRIALGRHEKFTFRDWLLDPIWKYERILRKLEYAINCTHKGSLRRIYWWWRLHTVGVKLGFTISPNTFGKGLSIAHYGSIVCSSDMKIGNYCRIHSDVNIGAGESGGAPIVGDNCYIGPGAKLFGNIVLGDNCKIGANAVVFKSFPEGNCTLVGVPAQKVTRKELAND